MTQVKAQIGKQSIEQVHSGRISKFAENIKWTIRPEFYSVGEVPDVGDVETQVAQIMRRLNPHCVPVVVKKPAERAAGEHAKNKAEHPKPERAIFDELVNSLPGLIPRGRG